MSGIRRAAFGTMGCRAHGLTEFVEEKIRGVQRLRVTSLDAPAIYSPKVEPRQLPRPTDVVDKVLSIC